MVERARVRRRKVRAVRTSTESPLASGDLSDNPVMAGIHRVAPWRMPLREDVAASVRDLRSARSGPRWARPLGIALIVAAVAAAFDPDYPMPREVLQAILQRRVTSEGLVAMEPRGALDAAPASFRWSWNGDGASSRAFTLVALDAESRELARVPVKGCEMAVEGPFRHAIETAAEFHWYVETSAQNGVVRSVPAACAISR
jgi:hypothetical protein